MVKFNSFFFICYMLCIFYGTCSPCSRHFFIWKSVICISIIENKFLKNLSDITYFNLCMSLELSLNFSEGKYLSWSGVICESLLKAAWHPARMTTALSSSIAPVLGSDNRSLVNCEIAVTNSCRRPWKRKYVVNY